ncbi:hypothetical protein C1H46_000050 [Malus baccata]|uniref:Tubulin binding cofactor C-like domain-containing protein n=1 Tax=Malus baccata TaxID=106549 RepID=A0A540NSW8_MALBA|nr:hypothetical protein C1H46_000050 [Malus baccata]
MNDFYQRVRSRLIIEDSYGVRFTLYCLRYKGIEEELREASLDEETEKWRMISCGCGRFSYQTGQFCRRMRDLAWLIFQIPRGVSVLPILCVTSACSEYKGSGTKLKNESMDTAVSPNKPQRSPHGPTEVIESLEARIQRQWEEEKVARKAREADFDAGLIGPGGVIALGTQIWS